LQILFDDEEQKSEQGQGFLDKAAGIFSSISRMMKSIWWLMTFHTLSLHSASHTHSCQCMFDPSKLILETLQLSLSYTTMQVYMLWYIVICARPPLL